MPTRSQLLLAYGAIYLIWGSTYLAIQIGIETLPPFLMAGLRFFGIGVPVFLLLRWRGRAPWPTAGEWGEAAILGGLMLAGGNGAVTWAEEHVVSSIAALFITTVPMWMVLLDRVVYRERNLGGWAVAGLACGFLGVVLLVGPAGNSLDRVDPRGAAALVFGSLLWAIGSLRSRRRAAPARPLLFVSMQMVAAGIILFAAALLRGELRGFDPSAVSLRSMLAVVYLSIFGSLVALTAYMWLLRHQPASSVATYAFVNPIVAVTLGTVFADEHIGVRALCAGFLIIGAVVLIHLSRMRLYRARLRLAQVPDEA
jgi:drug/metabolite transporter (DMT)-like permease